MRSGSRKVVSLLGYLYFIVPVLLVAFPLANALSLNGYDWNLIFNTTSGSPFAPLSTDSTGIGVAVVNNLLVVHGGGGSSVSNYAYVYDFDLGIWRNNSAFPNQLPMLPAVPDYTTLVTGDNKVYVMGGLLGGGVGMLPLNESVQVFDPGTFSWSLVNPTGGAIPERFWPAATYDITTNSIFVYGGQYFPVAVYDDLWKLNLVDLSWTEITSALTTTSGITLTGVVFSASWQDPLTRMWYIQGGKNQDGVTLNQFFVYSLGENSTTLLSNTGAPGQLFGTMFPLLPYSVNPANQSTSLVVMGGVPTNYNISIWNSSTGDWTTFPESPLRRIAYAKVAVVQSGLNSFDIYSLFAPSPATLFRLGANLTATDFIVAVGPTPNSFIISFPQNEPIISITPTDSTGATIPQSQATFGFGAISEIMPNGTVVQSVAIQKQQSVVSSSQSASILTYVFTIPQAIMEFQVVLNDSTTFQSAGITFQVPSNSVKISITINAWPFNSTKNYLQVQLPYTTLFPDTTLSSSSTNDTTTFTLTNNGDQSAAAIIRCLLLAEIDGIPQSLIGISSSNPTNGTGFINVVFPYFADTLFYDPDFSVVLQGSSSSGDGGSNTSLIVGLAVGLGVGIPLLAFILLLVILAVSGGLAWYRKHKLLQSRGDVNF